MSDGRQQPKPLVDPFHPKYRFLDEGMGEEVWGDMNDFTPHPSWNRPKDPWLVELDERQAAELQASGAPPLRLLADDEPVEDELDEGELEEEDLDDFEDEDFEDDDFEEDEFEDDDFDDEDEDEDYRDYGLDYNEDEDWD